MASATATHTGYQALGMNGFTWAQGVAMAGNIPLCHLQGASLKVDIENVEIKKGETAGKYIFPIDKTFTIPVEMAGVNPLMLSHLMGGATAGMTYGSGVKSVHYIGKFVASTHKMVWSTVAGQTSAASDPLLSEANSMNAVHVVGQQSKRQYIVYTSRTTSTWVSSPYSVTFTSKGTGCKLKTNTSYATMSAVDTLYDVYFFRTQTTGATLKIDPSAMPGSVTLAIAGKLLQVGSEGSTAAYDDVVLVAKNARIRTGFEIGLKKAASTITAEYFCPNASLGDLYISFVPSGERG